MIHRSCSYVLPPFDLPMAPSHPLDPACPAAQLVVDPKSAQPDELILVAPLGFNFTAFLGGLFLGRARAFGGEKKIGKMRKNQRKTIGKWKNHRKNRGKMEVYPVLNGKIIGKPQKTIGKRRFTLW